MLGKPNYKIYLRSLSTLVVNSHKETEGYIMPVNYSATELPEHLKSSGIPPFSGCVHNTNTAYLSTIQLLLLFLDFLVRLRTVFSLFRIRKDISAGY